MNDFGFRISDLGFYVVNTALIDSMTFSRNSKSEIANPKSLELDPLLRFDTGGEWMFYLMHLCH